MQKRIKQVTPYVLIVALAAFGFVAVPRSQSTASYAAQSAPTLATRKIVVDHTSLALFSQIPDQYLTAARAIRVVFWNKSVGLNISSGLSTLAANPKYNRDNWDYHEWPASGCGGWADIVGCFYAAAGPVASQYDLLGFDMSYLEVSAGSGIGAYWEDTANLREHSDYEAFFATRPNQMLLHMTSSLSRDSGSAEAQEFNEDMREHVNVNGGPLLDIADIESYSPTGAPCYDNRDGVYESQPGTSPLKEENYPNDNHNYPAICGPKAPGGGYTVEVFGGHLNSLGKTRLAQAFWVLMAQLAGWVPPGTTPIPTATNTPTTVPATATFTPIPPTISPLQTPTGTTVPNTPTPTPTDTIEPTATDAASATPFPPTDTPTPPLPSPTPTNTAIPPTATPTPTATATATPEPTPTVTLCQIQADTIKAALQLWLDSNPWRSYNWPFDPRYKNAAMAHGRLLSESEVSYLITEMFTCADGLNDDCLCSDP